MSSPEGRRGSSPAYGMQEDMLENHVIKSV